MQRQQEKSDITGYKKLEMRSVNYLLYKGSVYNSTMKMKEFRQASKPVRSNGENMAQLLICLKHTVLKSMVSM